MGGWIGVEKMAFFLSIIWTILWPDNSRRILRNSNWVCSHRIFAVPTPPPCEAGTGREAKPVSSSTDTYPRCGCFLKMAPVVLGRCRCRCLHSLSTSVWELPYGAFTQLSEECSRKTFPCLKPFPGTVSPWSASLSAWHSRSINIWVPFMVSSVNNPLH